MLHALVLRDGYNSLMSDMSELEHMGGMCGPASWEERFGFDYHVDLLNFVETNYIYVI